MRGEKWRFVPGFEPYEVSSFGRVRRGSRLLKAIKDNGYLWIDTSINAKRRRVAVHTMVALAFIGPRPSPQHEVAHSDGAGNNDCVENLRWATRKENAGDRDRHGRTARGQTHGCAVLTPADVEEIRSLYQPYSRWNSTVKLGERFGVSQAQIHRIITGRSW